MNLISLTKILSLFRYLPVAFFIYNPGFAQTIHDGFISLNATLKYHNTQSADSWFTLPIEIEGVSQDFDLRTRIQLISDLVNAGEYFAGSSAFLQPGQLYEYSFFSLSLDYAVFTKGDFVFHAGWAAGHKGLMHTAFSGNGHNFFAAAQGAVTWFFYKHLSASVFAQVPIAIYQENSRAFRQARAGTEILFDPIGPVKNPSPSTVFFVLGCEYQYTSVENSGTNYYQNLVSPYFRFSFLY